MPKVVAFLYLSLFAVVLKLQLDDGQILQILSEYIEFCLKNNISGASDMFIALFIKSKRCDKNTYIEPRLFRIFMSVDPKQYLTDFGRKNYGGVLKCLYDLLNTDYLLTGENYLFKMYDFRRSSVIFEPSLGINFAGKNEALSEHAGFLIGDILAPVISEQKRIAFSKNILREAENIFRQKAGIQRVGEGWVSETLLLRRVEAAFPDVEVKQHASPSFLGRQHYDIHIPDHKIALEYQGEQHFRPVDFFGGEDAYGKAVIRDLKKELSKSNNVIQIDVLPDYNIEDMILKLAEALGINDKREINERTRRAKEINVGSLEEANLVISAKRVNRKIKKEKNEEAILDDEMDRLLSLREKSPYAGCDMFMNTPDEYVRKMLNDYHEICQISKANPEQSNIRARKLFESGYRAPAIYERMAINYHKTKKYDEELDLLLQVKVDFGYNFDERIKRLIRLKLLG